jgi:ABC-2 type transport system ATP-binding protein
VQQEFYAIVRAARATGSTIFVSSHVLSEVEHICDRVGIVREGRLATVSKLGDLVGMRAFHVEIEFADGVPAEQLRTVPGLEQLRVDDRRASAILRGSFEPLMAALIGRRVIGLVSREPSLEEIFLTYYEAKR